MKTEVAVLNGKETFGVRLELTVKEAEILKSGIDEINGYPANHTSIAEQLNLVINNVKNLNKGDFDSPHNATPTKKGKAK